VEKFVRPANFVVKMTIAVEDRPTDTVFADALRRGFARNSRRRMCVPELGRTFIAVKTRKSIARHELQINNAGAARNKNLRQRGCKGQHGMGWLHGGAVPRRMANTGARSVVRKSRSCFAMPRMFPEARHNASLKESVSQT